MEIYGSRVEKVDVDPITVISKLKSIELSGDNDWVFEKNGKYYHGFYSGCGSHSWDDEREITKDKYDFIVSLDYIRKYLTNKNKTK